MTQPKPTEDPALLTRVLRIAGAVLLIAAASTFMLQRWEAGNDLLRYGMLLGHTVLLSGAAYFCGINFRESRGARTFLALTLAIVPINFAVLGGLVYSQFRLDPAELVLPGYATWIAPSPELALVTCGVALVVLVPLCFVAFLALARPQARVMTLAFLVGNLAILVPVRDSNVVAVLVGGLGVGVVLLDARLRRGTMRTLEGRLARTMLVVPPALIAARCIHLYAPTLLFVGVLALSVAHILFTASRRTRDSVVTHEVLLGMSALLGLVGWTCCAFDAHRSLHLLDSVVLPLMALPGAALLFGCSLRSRGGGTLYRFLASALAFSSVCLNLILYPEWLASLAVLLVGVALLAHGAAIRNRVVVGAGAGTLLFGLAYHMQFAIELEGFAWVALSVLGIGLIVAASYVERHRASVVAYLRRLGDRQRV